MTQQLHSGESSAVGAADFPFAALPIPPAPSETVINPERRGASGTGTASAPVPESTVVNRLFPTDPAALPGAESGPAGFELGHFVLEERIGAGGMGAVFRALDTRLQRVVALKVLSPSQSRDAASVQRFQNEARAAARLDHDNVARVYYIGEDKTLHFIAFEYVTGTNLRDLIKDVGPLHPAEAVNYTLQIANALSHTQAAGVVHRDIKPSNIIVAPNGRAKLVDLGLARKINSDSVGELTLAGTTLGTFDYISPEQARDPRNVDVRSDIYSLGCTLYHMLTGEPPYPGGTVLQKLLDHQGSNPPDPAARNSRVPVELSALVQKMMASDPRHRYPAPEDLIRDLMRLAGAYGLRGLPPEGLVWAAPPNTHIPPWKRNAGWVMTAALLLLIAFVVGRLPTDDGRRSPEPGPSQGTAHGAERRTAAGGGTSKPTASLGHGSHAAPAGRDRETAQDGTSGSSRVRVADLDKDPRSPAFPWDAPLVDLAAAPANPDDPLGLAALRMALDDPGLLLRPSGSEAGPTLLEDVRRPRRELPISEGESPAATDGRPTDVVASTAPATADQPFWVMAASGSATPFATLQAACEHAQEGDSIELRFDGRRATGPERPVRIVGKRKLTIRGAEGVRPVLEFVVGAGRTDVESRMLTLIDASVDFYNVDLVMTVAEGATGEQPWAVLSLHGAGGVRLESSSITIAHREAGRLGSEMAFVELGQAVGGDTMGMGMTGDMGAPPQPSVVSFRNCLIRGSGDVVRSESTRPAEFSLENVAVAVDGSLLHAPGSRDAGMDEARLDLHLNHVTCVVGRSLIRVDSGREPLDLLPLSVDAEDSIVATRGAEPLVAMTGSANPSDLHGLLYWSGDGNVYDGFEWFWVIDSDTIGPSVFTPLDFAGWESEWNRGMTTREIDAHDAALPWQEPWTGKDLAWITPLLDLQLDPERRENTSLIKAADGRDVGADLYVVPQGPPPPDGD